ncbi:hypothetical protein [Rhodanobacter sp. FW106-PBR-LB-2-11]|uniref:hypothetical protein n=1 Tax=Rhodanobacter sp. FW106-PBR-LB-2-11 TaxID=1524463 RepID=UPI0034E3DE24
MDAPRSALLAAAAEGHEQIVRALCRRRRRQPGRPPRQHRADAAAPAPAASVQLLAEAEADASARDSHGRRRALACPPVAARPRRSVLLALGADPEGCRRRRPQRARHARRRGPLGPGRPARPSTTPLPASLSQDVLAEGSDTPAHLLDALRFGHWAIVSGFAERVREWPQPQLAQLYLDLAAPGLAAARRWLLDHGLDAEARLETPRTDDPDTADAPALPPLGQRLFDALLPALPDATGRRWRICCVGASSGRRRLLARALA